MAIIKSVQSGQPITAAWANSVVAKCNVTEAANLGSSPQPTRCSRGIKQTLSDPAFHIRTSYGVHTINAGQVYINNILVNPTVKTDEPSTVNEGESGYTSLASSNSYNMYSSLQNWKENYQYISSSPSDLPIWYITLSTPKVVTTDNVKEVEAKLEVTKKGGEAPKQPEQKDGEESKRWYCIQLNDVEGQRIIQKVSGSIYLNTGNISLVSGDGILIESDTSGEVFTVNTHLSFIGEDGIIVTESYTEKEETTTDDQGNTVTTKKHPKKVITIKGDAMPMSFIGIDGITVTEDIHNVEKTNADGSTTWSSTKVVTIEHDIKSFIGKDNIKVTEEVITETTTDPNTNEQVTKNKKVIVIQQDMPSKFSFIGEDGITVAQSEEEVTSTDDQGNTTTEKVTVVTIGQDDSTKFSFIGEDGITVTQSEETVTSTDSQGNTVTEKMQVVTIGNNNSNEYEFVGKDGVEVTTEEVETTTDGKTTKKTKVTIGASVIADVDVDVRGG